MNTKTEQAIIRHGESLIAAFPNCTEKNPVALCKKLRRIENSLTRPLTDYCNGTFQDDDEGTKIDAVCDKAKAKVQSLLYGPNDKSENRLLINLDPRGYALKLDDAWTREYNFKPETRARIYTDIGGYGILAPDLNQ